jgi:hypothetical protein
MLFFSALASNFKRIMFDFLWKWNHVQLKKILKIMCNYLKEYVEHRKHNFM